MRSFAINDLEKMTHSEVHRVSENPGLVQISQDEATPE